jgi:hypothetical protein
VRHVVRVWKITVTYKISVGKPEVMRPLTTPVHRWEDYIGSWWNWAWTGSSHGNSSVGRDLVDKVMNLRVKMQGICCPVYCALVQVGCNKHFRYVRTASSHINVTFWSTGRATTKIRGAEISYYQHETDFIYWLVAEQYTYLWQRA